MPTSAVVCVVLLLRLGRGGRLIWLRLRLLWVLP